MTVFYNQGWAATYTGLVENVLKYGTLRPSREGNTLDNGPMHIGLTSPVEFQVLEGRGGSLGFAVTEQLCYLSGLGSDPLLVHAPSYERFRGRDGGWPGAYGPRIARGITKIVDILGKNPDSRQAVLDIHNINDTFRVDTLDAVDIPCTLALIFYIRDGKLCLHATMRSSDVWFGIYYDIPAFCFIQRRVAEALNREAGRFDLTTSSLHLYEKHEGKAWDFVKREGGPIALETANQLTNWEPDASGSPVYRIQSMQITAAKILGRETSE